MRIKKKKLLTAGALLVVSLYIFRDETPDVFHDDEVYHYLGENSGEEREPQAISETTERKLPECFQMPTDNPIELYRTLSDTRLDDEKNEVDEGISEVFEGEYHSTQNNKTQMGRFFEAQRLATADGGTHLTEAIKMMSELKAEDPSNGAYPYFMASLKSRAGHPPAEIREELMKAMMVPNFDTHVKTITTRVLEKGMKDVPSYMAAAQLKSKIPTPDYSDSYELMKIFAKKSDPEFSELTLNFGKRLMDDGYLRSTKPEGAGWLATEYEIGRKLVKDTWSNLHESDIPPRYLAPHNKLLETYSGMFPGPAKSDCPSDSYKQEFEILKRQAGNVSY